MQFPRRGTQLTTPVEEQHLLPAHSPFSDLAIPATHLLQNDPDMSSKADLSTGQPHQSAPSEQTNILRSSSCAKTALNPSTQSGQIRPFSPPYFRLTDQEHKDLQKRSHQSSTYVFGNPRILRELDDLGRGWSAFVRAREQAERDGSLATFQLQLKAEMDETAHLGLVNKNFSGATQRLDERGSPLPPGAVSLQAAEEGSDQMARPGTKRKRLSTSELKYLDMDGKNGKSRREDEISDEDSEPSPVYRSRGRGRGQSRGSRKKTLLNSSDSSDRTPRPKRNQKRPDYTLADPDESPQSSPASTSEGSSSSSPLPHDIYQSRDPTFPEFPCEWKGCRAKLMNLGTLEKHLAVVHSQEAREQLRCQWGKCGRLRTPMFFCKLSDVDGHVKECHIQQVAWKLGDGFGGVAGGPLVPDTSANPPLRLFRNISHPPGLFKDRRVEPRAALLARQQRLKEAVSEIRDNGNETDTESSDDDNDEDIPAY